MRQSQAKKCLKEDTSQEDTKQVKDSAQNHKKVIVPQAQEEQTKNTLRLQIQEGDSFRIYIKIPLESI